MAFIDNVELHKKNFNDNNLKLITIVYHGEKRFVLDNKNTID